MRKIGLTLLQNYPKCSPDLNPIESVWKLLRDRLDATLPRESEHREAFMRRLRAAVDGINRNHVQYMRRLCSCQKEWARDVREVQGARACFRASAKIPSLFCASCNPTGCRPCDGRPVAGRQQAGGVIVGQQSRQQLHQQLRPLCKESYTTARM